MDKEKNKIKSAGLKMGRRNLYKPISKKLRAIAAWEHGKRVIGLSRLGGLHEGKKRKLLDLNDSTNTQKCELEKV